MRLSRAASATRMKAASGLSNSAIPWPNMPVVATTVAARPGLCSKRQLLCSVGPHRDCRRWTDVHPWDKPAWSGAAHPVDPPPMWR